MKAPESTPAIVLHIATVEQHLNGSITGVVYWRCNGQCFPDDEWNDFIVVVVGWWVKAMSELLDGSSTSETMEFMDGPYAVVLSTVGDSANCQFVDRHKEPIVVASFTVEPCHIAQTVFNAGKTLLHACHAMGYRGTDIENLQQEVNRLRKVI